MGSRRRSTASRRMSVRSKMRKMRAKVGKGSKIGRVKDIELPNPATLVDPVNYNSIQTCTKEEDNGTNIYSLCRICLKEDAEEMFSIHDSILHEDDDQFREIPIYNLLEDILGMQIETARNSILLPVLICNSCIQFLRSVIKFRHRFFKSQDFISERFVKNSSCKGEFEFVKVKEEYIGIEEECLDIKVENSGVFDNSVRTNAKENIDFMLHNQQTPKHYHMEEQETADPFIAARPFSVPLNKYFNKKFAKALKNRIVTNYGNITARGKQKFP